jgi:hypothetical protein
MVVVPRECPLNLGQLDPPGHSARPRSWAATGPRTFSRAIGAF